jgi:hypothetical protein
LRRPERAKGRAGMQKAPCAGAVTQSRRMMETAAVAGVTIARVRVDCTTIILRFSLLLCTFQAAFEAARIARINHLDARETKKAHNLLRYAVA